VDFKSKSQQSFGERYLDGFTTPASSALGGLIFAGSTAGKELGKAAVKGAVSAVGHTVKSLPFAARVFLPTAGTALALNTSRVGLEDQGVDNAGAKALLGHAELGLQWKGDSLVKQTGETVADARKTAAQARKTMQGVKAGKAQAMSQLGSGNSANRKEMRRTPKAVKRARAVRTGVKTGAKGAVGGAKTIGMAGKTGLTAAKGISRAGASLGKGLLYTGAATAAAGSLVEAAAKTGLLPSAIEGASGLLGGEMDIDREKMSAAAEEFNKTDVFGVEVPVALDPLTSVAMANSAIEDLQTQNEEQGLHGDSRIDRARFVRDQVAGTNVGLVPGAADVAGGVYLVGDTAGDVVGTAVDAGVGAVTGTASAVASGGKALIGMGLGLFG